MERWWRAASVAGVVSSALLVAAACAPSRSNPPPVARIGAALSLTGSARLFGMAQRNGISLAQGEINASQMLGRTRLDVMFGDDASDRDQAAAVFQRFIENNHVVAIMGPTLSDSALSVDPLAQQAAVPVLAISNSASNVTQIGNFVFRESLSESQLAPQLVKAICSRMKLESAALLYSDTDPNRSGSHGYEAALEAAGVRIIDEATFALGETDFSPQLDEIASTHPGALFVTAPSSAAAAILVQARQHGLASTPIVGSASFNSDSVLRSAGAAAEGLIVGSAWTAGNQSARNQQFIQSYRSRYGADPDQLAAEAYTGVYILASALQSATSVTDARAVRDALENVHGLNTPLGAFGFNANRDADYPAVVQIVRQGKFVPY